jgi:peptidyl-prolyl cis-trans isomerase D
MFIAHGEKVRKHARWIMAGILILLIPGFIMLFTTTSGDRARSTNRDLPSINGKPIEANEYQQAIDDVISDIVIGTGRAPSRTSAEEDQIRQQAVLRILLTRKAKELGLRVSDVELQQHLKTQPVFTDEAGNFDPRKYAQSMQYLGNNFAISPVRFEELMRQQILINRLQQLITSAAKATPEAVTLATAPLYEPTTVQLIEFNATNAPLPSVTDADALASYNTAKDSYRIPKRIKVRYALFSLDEAKKAIKITDAEITKYYELNQTNFTDEKGNAQPLAAVTNQIRQLLTDRQADAKAANTATDFAIQLVKDTPDAPQPDFTKLAQAAGAVIGETDFFTAQGPVKGLEVPPAFRQPAFSLNAGAPYSDPIPSGAGYYVLQFLAEKPSEIPPFEQVKTEVIEQLQRIRQLETAFKQAQDTHAKIKQDLDAGKKFADICSSLKITPRKLGPFTLSDDSLQLPGGMFAREVVLSLPTNSISDIVRSPAGATLIYLQDRQSVTTLTNAQDIANMAALVLRQNQQALFNDWLRATIEQEKVTFAPKRATVAPTNPLDENPQP